MALWKKVGQVCDEVIQRTVTPLKTQTGLLNTRNVM